MDFFKHAKNMSLMSSFHKCHTGCIISYKNKIISTGFNQSKTHPIQRKYNTFRFDCESEHYIHSEVHAISQIIHNKDINWSRVHVYTYRQYKDGKIALSRPCASCLELIKDLGIKHIHYTTRDGYVHEILKEQV